MNLKGRFYEKDSKLPIIMFTVIHFTTIGFRYSWPPLEIKGWILCCEGWALFTQWTFRTFSSWRRSPKSPLHLILRVNEPLEQKRIRHRGFKGREKLLNILLWFHHLYLHFLLTQLKHSIQPKTKNTISCIYRSRHHTWKYLLCFSMCFTEKYKKHSENKKVHEAAEGKTQ